MIDKGSIHMFITAARDALALKGEDISTEALERTIAQCERNLQERDLRKLIRKAKSKKRSEHDVIREYFEKRLCAEEKKIRETPPEPKYPSYVPPTLLQICRENISEFFSVLGFAITFRLRYWLDPRRKLEMNQFEFTKVACDIKDAMYLGERLPNGLLSLEGELLEPEPVRGDKVSITLYPPDKGPKDGFVVFNSMLDPLRPIRAQITMQLNQATMDLICERLKQDGISPHIGDLVTGQRKSGPPPADLKTLGLVFDVWHLGKLWRHPDLACFIKSVAIADPKKRDIFNKDRLN